MSTEKTTDDGGLASAERPEVPLSEARIEELRVGLNRALRRLHSFRRKLQKGKMTKDAWNRPTIEFLDFCFKR